MSDQEFEKFHNLQMQASADEDIEEAMRILKKVYSSAVKQGFTKSQAMDIVKTYITASISPKTFN